MTLHLRAADGRVVELQLAPRHPLVIGVELTGDLTTDVRRVVRADAIRRAADRHRAVARVVAVSSPTAELEALMAELNCRPLAAESTAPDVTVRDVRDDATPLPEVSGLELRYALLGGTTVGAQVADWQRLVAEWAESPSKPMCAEYVERADAAVDDDVDAATVLAVMREIELDPDLPPGCRFEMFAHLDAIVGLDLTSRVGQPPPLPPNR